MKLPKSSKLAKSSSHAVSQKADSPQTVSQPLPIGQAKLMQMQKMYGNRAVSNLLRTASQQAIQTKTVGQRQLGPLEPGTLVRVFMTATLDWEGTVKSYEESSQTYTIIDNLTETEEKVPRKQVAYHKDNVKEGNIPEKAGNHMKASTLHQDPEMEKQRYVYHVTAASNLLGIISSKGLVPNRYRPEQEGGFAGLDHMRDGKKKPEDISARLENIAKARNDLATMSSMSASVALGMESLFDAQEADAMLGGKDEFNYGTTNMESIIDYSSQILDAQKLGTKKNVVFRFRKGAAPAWYKDKQGVSDIRTLSTIPIEAMDVAFVSAHDASIQTEDFEQGLEWHKITDLKEAEILELLK